MHRRKARQGGRVYVRETGAINWDGSQRKTPNESNNIEKERKAPGEERKKKKSNLRLESGPLISSSRRWNGQKGRRFPPRRQGAGTCDASSLPSFLRVSFLVSHLFLGPSFLHSFFCGSSLVLLRSPFFPLSVWRVCRVVFLSSRSEFPPFWESSPPPLCLCLFLLIFFVYIFIGFF